MTLQEFMACPRDIPMEDWEKAIEARHKKERKIRRLYEKVQECEDALEVLADEKGSDRWNKWNNRLTELNEELWRIK